MHPPSTIVHLASTIAMMAAVVAAAHARAEDEAGAEDDGDDEHDACDDADPRGRDVQLVPSRTLLDLVALHDVGRRRGAIDGAGDGFW
jgi:hypothetical protein